ncbi:hypothetical protein MTO96_009919 [Rhipicephalus appendiculatus]
MARQAVEEAIEVTVTAIKDVAVRCLDPNFWRSCTAALCTSDSEPFVSALVKHMHNIAAKYHECEARSSTNADRENPHFDCLSTTTVVFESQSSPEDQDTSDSGIASSQSSNDLSDTQQSQGSQSSSSLSPPESGSSDFDDLLDL